MIGTVGSDGQAQIAHAHGCDYPIVYTCEDFAAEVNRLTKGEKLRVVYDSVGRETFMKSLDCLAPRGTDGHVRQCIGSAGPIAPGLLSQKGALFLTRPKLNHDIAGRHSKKARGSCSR